jgi:hypothetical protein
MTVEVEKIKVIFIRDYLNYKNGEIKEISKWEIFEINKLPSLWHLTYCVKYDNFLNLKKGYDKNNLNIYTNCWIVKRDFEWNEVFSY